MEMTRVYDVAKDITRHNSLMIGIPSKQNITNMLMNHDSSTDSLSKIQFCPAYRFCRELDRPYRLSILDGNHVQVGDIFLYVCTQLFLIYIYIYIYAKLGSNALLVTSLSLPLLFFGNDRYFFCL